MSFLGFTEWGKALTLGDLVAELERLSDNIEEGIHMLSLAAEAEANAEFHYRRQKAQAWQTVKAKTVAEKAALIDAATAQSRHARDKAANDKLIARESLAARRAQMSAWQTVITAHRAEAQLAGFGPDTAT